LQSRLWTHIICRSRISSLNPTSLSALFVFSLCRQTSGAFTIDSSTPTLRINLNVFPPHLISLYRTVFLHNSNYLYIPKIILFHSLFNLYFCLHLFYTIKVIFSVFTWSEDCDWPITQIYHKFFYCYRFFIVFIFLDYVFFSEFCLFSKRDLW
jgi:hypothetical protein